MPAIELSTAAFYAGRPPRALALWACSVPLVRHVPGALTAIHGIKSKPQAFMAARDYAQRNRLQYAVITFIVTLEQSPNPEMKPDELGGFDFPNILRMASTMSDQIGQWLRAGVAPGGSCARLRDAMPLQQALMQDPSLVGVLMESNPPPVDI